MLFREGVKHRQKPGRAVPCSLRPWRDRALRQRPAGVRDNQCWIELHPGAETGAFGAGAMGAIE